MLQRSGLLVILVSIVASLSATRIIGSKVSDQVAWLEQKAFKKVMSWYAERANLMNILIIYSNESNIEHYDLSKFISTIGRNPIVVNYHLVGKDKGGKKVHPRNPDRGEQVSSNSNAAVLFVPDEATFLNYLSVSDNLHKSKKDLTLIVMIPSERKNLCQGNAGTKYWKESLKNILQIIWLKYRILNVFLSTPSLPCIENYIFTWDPFFVGKNGDFGRLKRLKINADDPDTLSGFFNAMENMNGFLLKVVVFERFPTMFTVDFQSGMIIDMKNTANLKVENMSGLDGQVLKTITSKMNCSVSLSQPSNNAEYGYQLENGSYVGLIGDIINRRVDFAANGVFLKNYGTATGSEFTTPISWDSMCIVVPRAKFIPLWLQTFLCFSPLVWGLLSLTVLICSLTRYTLRLLLRKERPERTFFLILIETMLIFVGSPGNLPRGFSERTLLVFWFFFGIIVMGTFQGTLYESFTNPLRYHDLNTLAELDKSGLKIGTSSPNLGDIFGKDNDSVTLMHLREKVEVFKNPEISTIERTATKKDIAAIERKNDLSLTIKMKFLDENGDKILHKIGECPSSYYLTYLVPSGAFYIPRMNYLLRRIFESGLIEYWYNTTVNDMLIKSRYSMIEKFHAKDQAVAYNFANLQTSFIILASGLLMSTFVFIGEKLLFHYRKELKPTTETTRSRRNLMTIQSANIIIPLS